MKNIEYAKVIMKTLIDNHYEAYIVGGYVRDTLLNKRNSDIDIATNALPDEVIKLFDKTIPTGLKHGTVTVVIENYQFEVTTFRKESRYINNRKPEKVRYVSSLKEDIMRRDFTMNALALTIDGKVIDYVHGEDDIKNKVIRTVGNPFERFNEDALRMLRAFRFMSSLGFNIDDESIYSIKENAHLIKNISLERIIKEFENMIKGEFFLKSIHTMIDTSFQNVLPYFKEGLEKINETKFPPSDLIEFLSICSVSGNYELIETLPIANYIKKEVRTIYEMYLVGITDFNKLFLFRNGLRNCLVANKLNVYLRNSVDKQDEIKRHFESMPIRKQCDLKLRGDEIIKIYNKKAGGWISDVLDDICMQVLLGHLENDFEKIRQYLLSKK